MRLRLAVLFAGFLASACGGEAPAPSRASDEPLPIAEAVRAERKALQACGELTAVGYCGIRFGMPAEEARKAFPVPFELAETSKRDDDPERCYELFPMSPVTGLSVLVEGGKVGRIDVLSETVRMPDDLGVGSLITDIRSHFGAGVVESPNAFESEVTDVSATASGTKFVFEIVNGAVRAWRAGVAPTIDYTAHCA